MYLFISVPTYSVWIGADVIPFAGRRDSHFSLCAVAGLQQLPRCGSVQEDDRVPDGVRMATSDPACSCLCGTFVLLL